ncbi:hypothetical protein MNBD_PLANCTO02-186 [hydrothermal vent metagenome]|uniref:Calcineurin-like phosphoesterase domain-containing protein n=1 Tax=hydrothermal vent metagenome TaxID=652676 RepID=A0A3B1E8X4_9ZZZZ
MSSRTIAIGDIHGCDVALETLLTMIQPVANDIIIVLGDVIDRGPDSKKCVEQLLELKEKCHFVYIMGNHEEIMLEEYANPANPTGWRTYGGKEMLESYGGDFDAIPEGHIEFFQSGMDYWETETELFIHASLEPGVDLENQIHEWLRWVHLTGFESSPIEGKRIICGHTAQESGVPWLLENWICIDTKAHAGNPLTAFDVGENMFLQANQKGEARKFSLEQLKKMSR